MSQLENPLSRLGQFMKQSFPVVTSLFYHDKSCLLSASSHPERCRDKILLSSFFSVSASCLLSQHSSLGPSITSCRDLDSLSRPYCLDHIYFFSCWNCQVCYKNLQDINLVRFPYFCIKISNYIVTQVRKMDLK